MHIDVTRTSHSLAHTGVQQVVRRLFHSLPDAQGIVYDPYARRWRDLYVGETLYMEINELPPNRSSKRSSQWSATQKLRGFCARFGRTQPQLLETVLFPEVFEVGGNSVCSGLRLLRGRKFAIFHDALPLLFPEWCTFKSIAQHREYMLALSQFDGVISVSKASLDDLKAFWLSQSISESQWPACEVIHLASFNDATRDEPQSAHPKDRFQFLMIGTLEARKNHIGVLQGCRSLWDLGLDFHLTLIGGVNRKTGLESKNIISELVAKGYPISWKGAVTQETVRCAYRECDAVLFPSLYEGFGLPVVEAMSFRKPVICTPYGALSEVAEQGGCHILRDATSESIAEGVKLLVEDREYYGRLFQELESVSSRSWSDVTSDIEAFIRDVS